MADGMEGIDVVAVTAWFADRVENLATPLDFELLAGGHSNLTYRVTDGGGGAPMFCAVRRWGMCCKVLTTWAGSIKSSPPCRVLRCL